MSAYTMTTPCVDCPFLNTFPRRMAFPLKRLKAFAVEGEFHCHKSGTVDEDRSAFIPTKDSVVCAGMLIFNEKRGTPNQMMRICERLGFYDHRKLNMQANVR